MQRKMRELETGNIGTRHSLRSAYSRRPLRPLRGSRFALWQPDAFGAGASPHGSRTPARGGYGNTFTLATISRLLATVALLASAGCQMKEFASTPLYSGDEVKFTGAVEDRVNLWPLAYWREPVGKRCNEAFPIGDEMT